MVDTTSIVISVLSLVGALCAALFSAYLTYAADEQKRLREVKAQVNKYSDPLLISAHDLQERLWELLDTRVTYHERTDVNGEENLRQFTCFLLAQFLAWTYILKTKTQFLAFSEDKATSELRVMFYKINDELSTPRYNKPGWAFRLWPGHQLAIAESMIYHEKATDELQPMGWHQFRNAWKGTFLQYCNNWDEGIDKMLRTKVDNIKNETMDPIPDQRIRRLQHFLVDLIVLLDPNGQARSDRPIKKARTAVECDCNNSLPGTGGAPATCNGEVLRKKRRDRVRSENENYNAKYNEYEQKVYEKQMMGDSKPKA